MYRILIIRSLLGNFSWDLIDTDNERVIANSKGYTRKEGCYNTASKLGKSLSCPVEFLDLEKDYEE